MDSLPEFDSVDARASGSNMTLDDWFAFATTDADGRALPDMRPVLKGLQGAAASLRAAAWNDDARGGAPPQDVTPSQSSGPSKSSQQSSQPSQSAQPSPSAQPSEPSQSSESSQPSPRAPS